MKAYDLVLVIGTMSNTQTVGTVIEPWEFIEDLDGNPNWWTVMLGNGELINWPMSQLELVNESR
jgi:hypothetical protein